MAALPCPYCSKAIPPAGEEAHEHCPACGGSLRIAYRYRLVAFRGKIAGGLLYEGIDDGFDFKVAVLFAEDTKDRAAVARFIDGSRMFAELAGRGVIKIHQVGSVHDARPYVVMSWLAGSTLDRRVGGEGQLPPLEVIALTQTLLKGLSHAHRSMPPVVHGNIHPGKIGFLRPGEQPVLFGFEWAEQVLEQDSRLADAFVDGANDKTNRSDRAGDLRQLAVSIYYAATGDWIADRGLAEQRALIRERTPGPLGTMLERMVLAGGLEGYKSAVEASMDFDQLLEGDDNWQPRVRPADRAEQRGGAGWAEAAGAGGFYTDESFADFGSDAQEIRPAAVGREEAFGDFNGDFDDDDDDDDDDDELPQALRSMASNRATSRDEEFAAAARRAQATAAAENAQVLHATPAKGGKTAGTTLALLIIGVSVAAGVFIAISEDQDQDAEFARTRGVPPPEAIALPVFEPEPIPAPLPESLPEPEPQADAGFSSSYYYGGVVTGPGSEPAGLRLDERCLLWITPSEGALNCRLTLDCGSRLLRIYGAGNSGYTNCEVVDQRPVYASDASDEDGDGAITFDLRDGRRVVTLRDRYARPALAVELTLDDDGKPSTDPAPEPKRELNRIDEPAAVDWPSEDADAGDPGAEEPLPESLSMTQVLEGLGLAKETLLRCDVDPGTTLRMTITIAGRGEIGSFELDPEQDDDDVNSCIGEALTKASFPRFSGEPMSVVWPVRW